MSKTILTQVDGFTPLPDLLTSKYGYVTAAVWGAVWRYCQMEDGICKASLTKIGERLGMSRQTIMRHIKVLVTDGFLEDKTPSLKHKPHIYADTGKVGMYNRLGIGVSESHTETEKGVPESDGRYDSKSLKDSIKKEDKKPRDKEGQKPRTPKANDFPSNVLYRQVTEKYPKKANWHDVLVFMDAVEQRLGRPPEKDDLFPYYSAWTSNGWNEWSINWLEYAVKGELPKYNNGHRPQAVPQGVSAAQDWLKKRQSVNGQ